MADWHPAVSKWGLRDQRMLQQKLEILGNSVSEYDERSQALEPFYSYMTWVNVL